MCSEIKKNHVGLSARKGPKMLSKNQIKFANSLKQKKEREALRLFVIEGSKMVKEALASSLKIKQLLATADFIHQNDLEHYPVIQEVTGAELERITSLVTPNEAFAICEMPSYQLVASELKNKLSLVLDDIKDPGNMGTIIRIADWYGIEHIICSEQTVDVYNSKVVQSTMGSVCRIKVHYTDLAVFLANNRQHEKIPVFGALLEGENIYKKKLPAGGLIMIGNESKGIREALIPMIDQKIHIPSFSHFKQSGEEAESLNAAIATAIICSEFRRG